MSPSMYNRYRMFMPGQLVTGLAVRALQSTVRFMVCGCVTRGGLAKHMHTLTK